MAFTTITGSGSADLNLRSALNANTDDFIDALAGNDIVYGLSGNDSILAGDGDDTVYAGWGGDTVLGGGGNDTIWGDFESFTELPGLATLVGVNFNDSIDGGDGNDAIYAAGGADTLFGGLGADILYGDTTGGETFSGAAGNDVIDGGADNDNIQGEGGNDTLLGGTGLDSLRGGDGNDSADGGDGNDTIYAGNGADTVLGGLGNDTLYGDFGEDTSSPGNDSIDGGADNDAIFGEAGNDTLVGGLGLDILRGEGGDDSADGGDGNDTIYAGNGGDTLFGGAGNDTLWGDFGNDTSSPGNDSIDGGTGDDYIQGEAGNDTLAGGTGTNTLSGGAGNDTYQVSSLNDRLFDTEGTNHVVVSIDGYKAPTGTVWDAAEYTNGAQAVPYFIEALICGTSWSAFGTSASLTYGFMTVAHNPGYADGFEALTEPERDVVRSALSLWSAVSGLTFVEQVVSPDTATLKFGTNWQDESAGYAGLPTAGYAYFNNPTLNPYDNFFDGMVDWVVLHEIGHALGLKHPFETSNAGGSDTLSGADDNVSRTLMSYTDRGDYNTLGVFDIAAIQYLYGPKAGTASGNTTYTFNFANKWISDASGLDTFSAAAETLAVHLDINDGRWNWVGTQAASILDANQSFIQYNTYIEKALGGSGNDTIIGNELANTLTGNRGGDSMTGGAGNDTLTGGIGADWLAGGAGDDLYKGANGDTVVELLGEGTDKVESSANYTLGANVENLLLTGAAKNGTGNTLGNSIVGNAGVNSLTGGAGNDTLDGAAGADKLNGGAGNDSFVWDAADTLPGAVAGGADVDKLVLGGVQTLDLTGNTVITGMEYIELAGTNSLTVAKADLIALSTTSTTLYVDGGLGDLVYLSTVGGVVWTHGATAGGYDTWKSGNTAILKVDSDIGVSVI